MDANGYCHLAALADVSNINMSDNIFIASSPAGHIPTTYIANIYAGSSTSALVTIKTGTQDMPKLMQHRQLLSQPSGGANVVFIGQHPVQQLLPQTQMLQAVHMTPGGLPVPMGQLISDPEPSFDSLLPASLVSTPQASAPPTLTPMVQVTQLFVPPSSLPTQLEPPSSAPPLSIDGRIQSVQLSEMVHLQPHAVAEAQPVQVLRSVVEDSQVLPHPTGDQQQTPRSCPEDVGYCAESQYQVLLCCPGQSGLRPMLRLIQSAVHRTEHHEVQPGHLALTRLPQQRQLQNPCEVIVKEESKEARSSDSDDGDLSEPSHPTSKRKWFTSSAVSGSTPGNAAKAEMLTTMRQWFSKCGSRACKVRHPRPSRMAKAPRPKEKKLECSECCKVFSYPFDLKRHFRTHTGEKPFLCQDCGRSFAQATHLMAHRKTHQPKQAMSCSVCNIEFASRDTFLNHSRLHELHHRSLHCSYCDKEFVFTSELKRHERTHSGEKPFECPMCLRRFVQFTHMQHHQQRSCKLVPLADKAPDVMRAGGKVRTVNFSSQTGDHPPSLGQTGAAAEDGCGGPTSRLAPDERLGAASQEHPTLSTISFAGLEFSSAFLGMPAVLPAVDSTPVTGTMDGQLRCGALGDDSSREGTSGASGMGGSLLSRHRRTSNRGSQTNNAMTPDGCSPAKTGHTCSECSKTFRYLSALRRHLRIHTGEKPYLCTACDKRFTQSAHLAKHKSKHAGALAEVFTTLREGSPCPSTLIKFTPTSCPQLSFASRQTFIQSERPVSGSWPTVQERLSSTVESDSSLSHSDAVSSILRAAADMDVGPFDPGQCHSLYKLVVADN